MRPGPSPFVLLRASRAKLFRNTPTSRPLSSKYDLPPVPPLRTRLRGMLPFLFWWSVITSLAVNRLRIRQQAEEELGAVNAQISVLEDLVQRTRQGEVLSEEALRKELELVGLRERTRLTETEEERMARTKDVSWAEALLGRKGKIADEDLQDGKQEERDEREWAAGECPPGEKNGSYMLILSDAGSDRGRETGSKASAERGADGCSGTQRGGQACTFSKRLSGMNASLSDAAPRIEPA